MTNIRYFQRTCVGVNWVDFDFMSTKLA